MVWVFTAVNWLETLSYEDNSPEPDFVLRRGPSAILLAQPAFPPSVISSFLTQNKEVGGPGAPMPRAPPLDPPLVYNLNTSIYWLTETNGF